MVAPQKKKQFDKNRIETMAKPIKKPAYYKNPKKEFAVANVDTIASQKDTKEYVMSWVERIYALFQKNRTWMGSGFDDIDIMRRYMEGNQPVDKYRDFLYGKAEDSTGTNIDGDGFDRRSERSEDTRKRTAWVNIDEKPVSIAPKIVTKLLEQARGMYYEQAVNAVDSMSVDTEEMAEARLWFQKENGEWVKAQHAMMGIKQQEPDFMPINTNELELYAMSGGFKVAWATHIEQLLEHTFEISNWEKEVREKIIKDLSCLRYGMIREYYDPEDKRIKVKWVDPQYGGLQFSRDFSYTDSEYGFELEHWPISKVRQKFDLSHEEAASLAYAYTGQCGNPGSGDWGTYGYCDETSGSLGFDFYKVPVFRCEWIDVDNEKYYKHESKNGRIFNKPLKNKDPEGLDVFDNKIRYVREATWIVGSQYLADTGRVKYMVRNNPKKPQLSYKGIRLGVPALFHQIRPLLDGLSLAWWKTQEAMSIAISNGIAVDVGALKNISIGKDKSWDVTRVLQYYRQQAILLHKKANPMNFGSGGGGSPVQPLVTRMQENVIAQFGVMDKFMNLIESISGVNLVSTGSTPEPRTGKFNMQVALQGTNQIMGSIIRATTELQSDISSNVMYRIRSLCRNNKSIRDSYAVVIGKTKMQTVMMAEKSNVEYGVKIEVRDVAEMQGFIEEVLAASLKATSTDGGLLDASEVILIRDMMAQRQNMRMVSLTLGYMLRKKGREREMQKMKAIETQNAGLKEMKQMESQDKEKERMFELVKIREEFKKDFTVKWGVPPDKAAQMAFQATGAIQGQQQPPQVDTPPPTPVQQQV